MKRIVKFCVAILFLCASFMSAQKAPAQIVSSTYAWPESIKGKFVNIWALANDSKGWLYAGTVGWDSANNFGYVWRSKDIGKTWEQLDAKNGLDANGGLITSLFVLNQDILLAGGFQGIWRSSNSGDMWVLAAEKASGIGAFMTAPDGTIFAGGWQLWESKDQGMTWQELDAARVPDFGFIMGFATTRDGTIFAGCSKGVLKSTDQGKTWTWTTADPTHNVIKAAVFAIIVDPLSDFILVSTDGDGMFRSVDHGATWERINNGLSTPWTRGLSVSLKFGVFSGTEKGFFNSVNNGVFWFPVGLKERMISSFLWKGTDSLFVGTDDGVYLLRLDNLTDVPRETQLPQNFSLSQNYPNPFNPSTKISFSVPSFSQVTLKVCDLLGKEIATLVDEEKPTGNYEVQFNGSNLSSGVYFYTLRAGDYVATKKMILLK